MIRYDPDAKLLEVSVHDLLVEEQGDRFSLSQGLSRARLAIGRKLHGSHQQAQAAEPEEYWSELSLQWERVVDETTVRIDGRLDGLRRQGDAYVIEEIKSVLRPSPELDSIPPERLRVWETQVALYAWLLTEGRLKGDPRDGLQAKAKKNLQTEIVVISAVDGGREHLPVLWKSLTPEALIDEPVRLIVSALAEDVARRDARRDLADVLPFPMPAFRLHQEDVCDTIALNAAAGRHCLIQAPTGIGKTAAALWPMMRDTLAGNGQLFYVTPKTTQQQIVLDTAKAWNDAGHDVRAVGLRAKRKMCANDVYVCHPDHCRYAKDYQQKLARKDWPNRLWDELGPQLDPDSVFKAARRAGVCPFEVSLDASLQADLIVGDYNYVFDPVIALERFFGEGTAVIGGKQRLIIDEAHNLYDRACGYLSPTLPLSVLEAAGPKQLALFEGASFIDAWNAWRETLYDYVHELAAHCPRGAEEAVLPEMLAPEFFSEMEAVLDELMEEYLLLRAREGAAQEEDPIMDAMRAFVRMARVVPYQDGDAVIPLAVNTPEEGPGIGFHGVDPAKLLGPRLDRFSSVVAMSATLEPFDYTGRVLGFDPDRTEVRAFPSPFPPENRGIFVDRRVGTVYKQREKNAPMIARRIAAMTLARPGNYIVAFPSYAFLRMVHDELLRHLPEDCLTVQATGMSEDARREMLEPFFTPRTYTPEYPSLLMAVQGGIFTEGVDFRGDACIGVIIVGPALPRVCVRQELAKEYFAKHDGHGFEYAYLFPGMTRVVQAAGRAHRSPEDVGVIVLMGFRFATPNYQRCMPRHWYDDTAQELVVPDAVQAVQQFWSRHELLNEEY